MVKVVKKKAEPESDANADLDKLATMAIEGIKAGFLDGWLVEMESAMDDRIVARAAEARLAEKEKSSPAPAKEKEVPAAPKKTAPGKPAKKLEAGKSYIVGARVKSLAGARVKFLNPSAKDDTKATVEIVKGVPGYPKGKRVNLPTGALEDVPAKKK